MKIALGADHRGLPVAQAVVSQLRADGHDVDMLGEVSGQPCDYPDSAFMVASAVARGVADRGVLICGTGIGMCIAANKVKGIRAALAQDELSAQLSRTHNDANVLCLSADLLGQTLVKRIVHIWFRTGFEGGRHARRVEKIRWIEDGEDPSSRNGVHPGAASAPAPSKEGGASAKPAEGASGHGGTHRGGGSENPARRAS